jgi:Na+/melibiose symporter-like transporter
MKDSARSQLVLRALSFMLGWAITLTIATYSVFASRRLGYGQKELGLLYSGAAGAALVANVAVLPQLVRRFGERGTCTIGLLILGTCATGIGFVLTPPWHAIFFVARGVGVSITDTAVAALIAKYSRPHEKATNLGLSSSVQAGARLVCPITSGLMLDATIGAGRLGPPGANSLPFLVIGLAAIIASALPVLALPRLPAPARLKEQ